MLLALGPLQLDTTARTVVIGVADPRDGGCVDAASVGADAVWLRPGATAAQVREIAGRCDRPVGITVDDLDGWADLVAAGAVAVEVRSPDVDVAEVASARDLTLWCGPGVARRALDAGVALEHLVVEGGAWDRPGVVGVTVQGAGPSAWGTVVRAVLDGAGAVRTTDPRALRRVAAVVDRLVAARDGGRT